MLLDLFFGDAKLQLETDKHSNIKLLEDNSPHKNLMREFEITIPYKNMGSQELTILDAWTRVYLPDEQYDKLHISAKVNDSNKLRDDDYFEAMLVPAGKGGVLVLRFTAILRNCDTNSSIDQALINCPEFDVAIYCECRGRKEVYINKQIFSLTF
ncbi:MAG: hypothetical protein MJ032_04840 [Acidaminococcaceae bacterium]|nr:hypothetical protein [Acidaminococcaceae bacterium]